MPERRYAPINGSLTDNMKSEAATISGAWTFTSPVNIDAGNGERLTFTGGSTGNANNNWIQFDDSAGTRQGFIGFGSSGNQDLYVLADLGDIRFNSNTYAGFMSGTNARFYNNTDTDYLDITHNGTDVIFNAVNTDYFRWNNSDAGVTGHLHLYGMISRWYDDDNTNYVDIRQVGTDALIQSSGTGFESIKLRTNASTASQFSLGGQGSTAVADDASVEYTFNGTAYGIWFVTNSFNGTAFAIFAHTGATTYEIYKGTNAQIGASGTNPDVDTDANYWCDADGNLHIKNRLGSSRRFNAYHMSG